MMRKVKFTLRKTLIMNMAEVIYIAIFFIRNYLDILVLVSIYNY